MSTATQSRKPAASASRSSAPHRKSRESRRTTVTLSVEALAIVERLKAAEGFSTSGAIEELILRTEPKKSWLIEEDGLLVLNAPLKNGKLTNEDVKRLLDECPF
jgi:hypothetical protein